MIIAVFLIGLVLLFLLGYGAPYAIGLVSLLVLVITRGFGNVPLDMVATKLAFSANNFTLLAIPFFLLAGKLMNTGSITTRIFRFCNTLIGWIPGGLGHANVLASIVFAGMSGSAVADAAGLGTIEIKAMEEEGFDTDFSAAITAASSTIGPIIPPSIPLIVFGVSAGGISIAKLLIGGVLPGLLVGICLSIMVYVFAVKRHYPCRKFPQGKELWHDFKDAFFPLLTPIILIGGILSGVFTPTEASVIAVVYTLFVALMVTKTIRLKDIPAIFCDAARSTGTVMFVIGTSAVWSWILSYANIPGMLADAITSFTQSPFVVMMIITVIFLIGGMFIDGTPLIIMLVPLLYPVATAVGFDPLAFGIIICICNAMGAITPPVGAALFVACASGGVKLEKTFKYVYPIVIAELISIIILCIIPQLASFLPSIVGR